MTSLFRKLSTNIRGNGLTAHIFRGGAWLGVGSACEQFLRLGRNVVLTRVLLPEAFGVMAIIYSTSYVVDSFAQIGVKEAIIQNPHGNESGYVNSAWWLSFLRGLVIYAIMCALASWVANFYRHPELTALMRTALLGIVFTGAQSPMAYVALKEMKFKKWMIIQSSGGLLGSLFVVGLALTIHSVWALAVGYAVENFLRCIVSFIVCPFRPRVEVDKAAIRGLLTFSRGVFGLSFLYLLFSRTDVFVLGKILPASALGIYTMAVYLVQVPTSFIVSVLTQTLMPSFAQIQDDRLRINAIVSRATATLLICGMPVLVFVVLAGRVMLLVFYGSQYVTASSTLVVAAFVGLINIVNSVITVVFYAVGSPQFHRRCLLVMATLMLILIYPAVKQFGVLGGQGAALVAIIAGFASQLVRIERITKLDLLQYSRFLPGTVAACCGALVVAASARYFFPSDNPVATVSIGIAATVAALVLSSKQLIRQVTT